MSHKQDLISAIRAARTELEKAIAARGDRLDEAHGESWRLRDAIAHIEAC